MVEFATAFFFGFGAGCGCCTIMFLVVRYYQGGPR